MPWQEMSPMDQRMQFIVDHQRGWYAMSELCARNRMSRKTGYKWLARYAADGARGLVERSHAPHVCPLHTTAPNDLWTADFKGQCRTRNGVSCYPLTIADQHTRSLLRVHGLLNTRGAGVRPVFERAFRD